MAEYIDPFESIEENQKVSLITSGVAGIASGLIKVPKGVFLNGSRTFRSWIGYKYCIFC
jgi:hypothetical protein